MEGASCWFSARRKWCEEHRRAVLKGRDLNGVSEKMGLKPGKHRRNVFDVEDSVHLFWRVTRVKVVTVEQAMYLEACGFLVYEGIPSTFRGNNFWEYTPLP